MDTGFRQYDALRAFWDKFTVLSLPKHAKRFFGISIIAKLLLRTAFFLRFSLDISLFLFILKKSASIQVCKSKEKQQVKAVDG